MSGQTIPSPGLNRLETPYIAHKGVSPLTEEDRDHIARLHAAFEFLGSQVTEFEDAVRLIEELDIRRNSLIAEKKALRESNRYNEDDNARLLLFSAFRRVNSWQRMAFDSASQTAFDFQRTFKLINKLSAMPILGLATPTTSLLGEASDAIKAVIGSAREMRNASSHTFEVLISGSIDSAVSLKDGGKVLMSRNIAGSEFQSSWSNENHAIRVDENTLRVLAMARDTTFAAFKPMVDSARSLKQAQTSNPPQATV